MRFTISRLFTIGLLFAGKAAEAVYDSKANLNDDQFDPANPHEDHGGHGRRLTHEPFDTNNPHEDHGGHGRRLTHEPFDTNNPHEDHGGHGRLLTIFGTDSRVAYDPYALQRGVGLLEYTINKHVQYCTATLVARNFIATAANCVFNDAKVGGNIIRSIPTEWYQSAVFHFGFNNGAPTPLNSNPQQVFYPQEYADMVPGWQQFNYAIIQLKDALGDVTGYMNIEPLTKYNVMTVNLVGFMFAANTTAGAQYCCQIIGMLNGQVQHLCDTSYGSSGAPLYVQNSRKTPKGKEVFSYSLVSVNNGQTPGYNLGAITAPIAQLLQQAIEATTPPPKYSGAGWQVEKDIAIDCGGGHKPTKKPVKAPTNKHPSRPTHKPSKLPTAPTKQPVAPVPAPTNPPTNPPTKQPVAPVPAPTNPPTNPPTKQPVAPVPAPTNPPTNPPTKQPVAPVPAPTNPPTNPPTKQPVAPVPAPTNPPTNPPTKQPVAPVPAPTNPPTNPPTKQPVAPVPAPTNPPSPRPTPRPIFNPPSWEPSRPSWQPVTRPSYNPPSWEPTRPTGPVVTSSPHVHQPGHPPNCAPSPIFHRLLDTASKYLSDEQQDKPKAKFRV